MGESDRRASDVLAELREGLRPLENHLAGLKGLRVTALLNRGNRGDGLIHASGLALLDRLGIEANVIHYPEPAAGDHLLVFGCGGFSRYFNHVASYVDFYRSSFGRVTILPASFEPRSLRVRRFLRSLEPGRFTVFCRERVSYQAVRSLCAESVEVHLVPDLAFFFDAGVSAAPERGEGVLGVFRTDAERRHLIEVEADRIEDVSAGPESEPHKLIEAIAPYRVVHTDRLHSAVAAALLGKSVFLYEGNYHKNRAVFEFTLHRFPDVRLVTLPPESMRRRLRGLTDWPRLRERLRLRLLSALRPALYRWRRWRAARSQDRTRVEEGNRPSG